ncbi:hypothetical protein SAMN04488136_12127 [Vibrio xiamenensis]|uniref:Uncharacterized protein n=1 Tax=Vibrio xiamenensis TaxID=861298 RepID=A0A1G8DRP7_9VIBR|nr:hypothetical protein [Vibrio xiamenensis]SDH60265.1 hypothetical protein SAMN04488136_12127 [Vibrio xiamenensis]
MHLVCKFSLGSKLTKKELQYVLTPDECIGQLSRMRNIPDVLSQLPKTFSDQLPLSAKKDIHSLLAAIKQELIKANWVATSLLTRHVSISEAQLKAYPKFGLLVSSLSLTDIDKVHKAGYQAVTDDVPLARNLTYTPVTPSPDQKIVVEFAGQWPSNAACLMLGKTDAQKEKVTVSKVDHDNQHRSLATFKGLESEPKTLYIRIPCPGQPTPILLKLAEDLTPVDKDTDMDEWDNVLVPVRPLAYLDGSFDKAKASELQGGYLYLFWNNKLWREFEITDKGYYQDIDVEYYRQLEAEEQQKDQPLVIHRIADGFAMPHIWVPYKIAGEVQQQDTGLKLMFSPKQKRFSQIEALESDSDKLDAASTPLDELSIYSDSQAFSAQEHTSDVVSATVHAVTEDDMPWLSAQQTVVRSFDNSNTVVAYVDGKNSGFMVRVEVNQNEGELEDPDYQNLIAIMEDTQSDWKVSEAFGVEVKNGYIEALISGLPADGKFNLFLANSQGSDSLFPVFSELTYDQVIKEPEPFDSAAECEECEIDEQLQQMQVAENQLLDSIKQLIFG